MLPLGVLASARVASGTFTPASVSGLQGWWDSSDAATFTFSSGSLVSAWGDKSGNGRSFAQASGALQPSRTGTQNGLATIVFNGSTQYMDTSSFTVSQPLTLLYAASFNNTGSYAAVSSVGNNLQTYWNSNISLRYYAGTTEVVSFTGNEWNGAHVHAVAFNGASSASWLDGVAGATGNPGSSGTTTGLRIGERNLASMFRGDMFEILIYSGALTTTDRQALESYLKTKWGTP